MGCELRLGQWSGIGSVEDSHVGVVIVGVYVMSVVVVAAGTEGERCFARHFGH